MTTLNITGRCTGYTHGFGEGVLSYPAIATSVL